MLNASSFFLRPTKSPQTTRHWWTNLIISFRSLSLLSERKGRESIDSSIVPWGRGARAFHDTSTSRVWRSLRKQPFAYARTEGEDRYVNVPPPHHGRITGHPACFQVTQATQCCRLHSLADDSRSANIPSRCQHIQVKQSYEMGQESLVNEPKHRGNSKPCAQTCNGQNNVNQNRNDIGIASTTSGPLRVACRLAESNTASQRLFVELGGTPSPSLCIRHGCMTIHGSFEPHFWGGWLCPLLHLIPLHTTLVHHQYALAR